jgi:AcrR family transcriptional regulator
MARERDASFSTDESTEDVRERLIEAAERLVALHTDEGTSSRAIIAAAGQRHNSAITYHFGDRRGLLDAVWARRSAEVNRRRLEIVAGWSGREPELRELVVAWVHPFAEYVGSRRPSYWARFNEDELRHYPLIAVPQLRPRLSGRPQEEWLLVLVSLFEQIQQRICAGQEGPIRISTAIRMVIGAFAAWERDAEAGRQTISADGLADVMVECVLGLLERCCLATGEGISAPG